MKRGTLISKTNSKDSPYDRARTRADGEPRCRPGEAVSAPQALAWNIVFSHQRQQGLSPFFFSLVDGKQIAGQPAPAEESWSRIYLLHCS